MLDTETKRRIDTARDILVGKVPDPKSQVEQITIALIYKFMDDMDAEAVELGGKRKFFTGQYAGYRWCKLMELGGNDKYTSYSEGIAKMTQNEALPELFRNIFKNAYLPYRDPETLNAFLKTINEFSYDHSERLGDAFEYLLSVLGSQGDAGQFRTPRHIIDFMVEILAPKKNETVLDPACGTAGFLISAYKHILRTNTDAKGRSTLTPDDKGRLAKNFKGYDISPDMVRLSLVNLYLHGFTDPHVFEYDSLTQEERWNEYADVILANPPFMSPKGGIKPHKRFSIQAKRSEVLFVDYMAEHLTTDGRAAIIVPEGIIFQSQTAYTDLRKMLVENSLVAVVSLPAGCFNPYSGVKTSILILDKAAAKSSDTVAFFKVENDGFGLGAQRREVEKNDLPQVRAELTAYLHALRTGASTENLLSSTSTTQIVPKEKIAANGDYNLSGERYREGATVNQKWPLVELGEVIDELESGVSVNSNNRPAEAGEFGILKTSCVTSGVFAPEENKAVLSEELTRVKCPVRKNTIIISRMNTEALVGANAYIETGYDNLFLPDRLWQTVISRTDVLVPYVQHVIASRAYRDLISSKCGGTSGSMKNIAKPQFLSLQIPLPPLEVQKEIVAEIEGYQKVINGARAVLDHYRPHISIQPEWPMGVLADVCTLISGQHIDQQDYNTERVGVDYLTGPSDFGFKHPSASRWTSKPKVFAEKGDILMTVKGSGLGSVNLLNIERAAISRQLMAIRIRDADPEFIYVLLLAKFEHIQSLGGGAAIPGITREHVLGLKIPLPPLATQQAIVAEIEAEQALVAANRELITRFEKKIQATLARIWGEETIP